MWFRKCVRRGVHFAAFRGVSAPPWMFTGVRGILSQIAGLELAGGGWPSGEGSRCNLSSRRDAAPSADAQRLCKHATNRMAAVTSVAQDFESLAPLPLPPSPYPPHPDHRNSNSPWVSPGSVL